MKKVLAVLLALSMILCFAACGETKTAETTDTTPVAVKFVQGIDAEYPPFAYIGDDGEYTGFDVEICRAACELLGWEYDAFPVNWDEKLVQLDANECDCIWAGMTLLESMSDAGYVLSEPYFDSTQVLLVKSDAGIATSADLAGKLVAVQLGTSGEALLQGDLADLAGTFDDVITCDSFLKCATELDGGSVDAVFIDKPVAESLVAQYGNFSIIDENLGAEQYGIAFRSGDQSLCDQMEAAVAELVANGTYAEIAADYPDIVNNLIFLK